MTEDLLSPKDFITGLYVTMVGQVRTGSRGVNLDASMSGGWTSGRLTSLCSPCEG